MSAQSSSQSKFESPQEPEKLSRSVYEDDRELIAKQNAFFSLGFFHDKNYNKFSDSEINECFSRCKERRTTNNENPQNITALELVRACDNATTEVPILATIFDRLVRPRRGTVFCIEYAHSVYLIDGHERVVEPETSTHAKPYGMFAVSSSLERRLSLQEWKSVKMDRMGRQVEQPGRLLHEELIGDDSTHYTAGGKAVFDNIVEETLAASVYTEHEIYKLFLQQVFARLHYDFIELRNEEGRTFAIDHHPDVCIDTYAEQAVSNGLLITSYHTGVQRLFTRPPEARPFANSAKITSHGPSYDRRVIVDKKKMTLAEFIDGKFPSEIQTKSNFQLRGGEKTTLAKANLLRGQNYVRVITIDGLHLRAIDESSSSYKKFVTDFELGVKHLARLENEHLVFKPYYVLYCALVMLFRDSGVFEQKESFENWVAQATSDNLPAYDGTLGVVNELLRFILSLHSNANSPGPKTLKHWFLFDGEIHEPSRQTLNVGCMDVNNGSMFDWCSLGENNISQCYTEVNKVAGFIFTKMGIPMPPLRTENNSDELDLVTSCMEAIITMHIFTEGVGLSREDELTLIKGDLELLTDTRICVAAWYLVFKKVLKYDLRTWQFDRLFKACYLHIQGEDSAVVDTRLFTFLFNHLLNTHYIPYLDSFLTTIYDLRRFILSSSSLYLKAKVEVDFRPDLLNVVDPVFFLSERDTSELDATKIVYNWCRDDVVANDAHPVVMFGRIPVNFFSLMNPVLVPQVIAIANHSQYEAVHNGGLWESHTFAVHGRFPHVKVFQGRKHVQLFESSTQRKINRLSSAIKETQTSVRRKFKEDRKGLIHRNAIALFWLLQSSVFNEALSYDKVRSDEEKLASGIVVEIDHHNARSSRSVPVRSVDIQEFFEKRFPRLHNEKFNGFTNLMSTQHPGVGYKSLPTLVADALMSAPPLIGYQSTATGYSTVLARSGALSNWLVNTMTTRSSVPTPLTSKERNVRSVIANFLYDSKCFDYVENLMDTRAANYNNTYDFNNTSRQSSKSKDVPPFTQRELPLVGVNKPYTMSHFIHKRSRHDYQILKNDCMKLFDVSHKTDTTDETVWSFLEPTIPHYTEFDKARAFVLGELSSGSKAATCMPRTSEFYVPVNHYVHARINYDRTFDTSNICAYSASTRGLHSRGFTRQNTGFYITGTEAVVDNSAVFQEDSNAGRVQDPQVNDNGSYLSRRVKIVYDANALQHFLQSREAISSGTIIGRLSGEVKEVSFYVQSVVPGQSYESLEHYLKDTFDRDTLYPVDECAWFEYVSYSAVPAVSDYTTPQSFYNVEQERIDERAFTENLKRLEELAERKQDLLVSLMSPREQKIHFLNELENTKIVREERRLQRLNETPEERAQRRALRGMRTTHQQRDREKRGVSTETSHTKNKRIRTEARLSNDDKQHQLNLLYKNAADPDNEQPIDVEFIHSFVDTVANSYIDDFARRPDQQHTDFAERVKILPANILEQTLARAADRREIGLTPEERKRIIEEVYNDPNTFYVTPIVDQACWGVFVIYESRRFVDLVVKSNLTGIRRITRIFTAIATAFDLTLSTPSSKVEHYDQTWTQSLWYSALRVVEYLEQYFWTLNDYDLPEPQKMVWPGTLVNILDGYAEEHKLEKYDVANPEYLPRSTNLSECNRMSIWCAHLNAKCRNAVIVDPQRHAYVMNYSTLNFPDNREKTWSVLMPFQVDGTWYLVVVEIYAKNALAIYFFFLFEDDEYTGKEQFLSKLKTAIVDQYFPDERPAPRWRNTTNVKLAYAKKSTSIMTLTTMRLLELYSNNKIRTSRLAHIAAGHRFRQDWKGVGKNANFSSIQKYLDLRESDDEKSSFSHSDNDEDLNFPQKTHNEFHDDDDEDSSLPYNDAWDTSHYFYGSASEVNLSSGGEQSDDLLDLPSNSNQFEHEQSGDSNDNYVQDDIFFTEPPKRKFPIVRANEYARFIVRGVEINAQYMGNPSRYVRYTNNEDQSLARFVRKPRHNGDGLSYWDIETTRDISSEKEEIVTVVPGRFGSEWQRLFMSGYPCSKKNAKVTNNTFGSTAFIVPLRATVGRTQQIAASPIPIYPPRLAPRHKIVPVQDDEEAREEERARKLTSKPSSSLPPPSSSGTSLSSVQVETPREDEHHVDLEQDYELIFNPGSAQINARFTIKSQLNRAYTFDNIHELPFRIPKKIIQTYDGPWQNLLHADSAEQFNYIVSPETDAISLKDSKWLSNTFIAWYAEKIFGVVKPKKTVYLGVYNSESMEENTAFLFEIPRGYSIQALLQRDCVIVTVGSADHWVLVFSYPREKQMCVFDPLNHYDRDVMYSVYDYRNFLERTLLWEKDVDATRALELQSTRNLSEFTRDEEEARRNYEEFMGRKSFELELLKLDQAIQQDGYACGMYNIYYATLACELDFPIPPKLLPLLREASAEARSFARHGYEALWNLAMLNTKILTRTEITYHPVEITYAKYAAPENSGRYRIRSENVPRTSSSNRVFVDEVVEKEIKMPHLLRNYYIVRVRELNQEFQRSIEGVRFPLFLEFLPTNEPTSLSKLVELTDADGNLKFQTRRSKKIRQITNIDDEDSTDNTLSSVAQRSSPDAWTEINFDSPQKTAGLYDLKFEDGLSVTHDVIPLMGPRYLSDTLLHWYTKLFRAGPDGEMLGFLTLKRLELRRNYSTTRSNLLEKRRIFFIPDAVNENSRHNSMHWIACVLYPRLNCIYMYDSMYDYNEHVVYHVQQSRNFFEEILRRKSAQVSDVQYLETRKRRDEAELAAFSAKSEEIAATKTANRKYMKLAKVYAPENSTSNNCKLAIIDLLLRDAPLEDLYTEIAKLEEAQRSTGDTSSNAMVAYLVELVGERADSSKMDKLLLTIKETSKNPTTSIEIVAFDSASRSRSALRQSRKSLDKLKNIERCLYCITDDPPIRIVDAFETRDRHQTDTYNCGLFTLYYLQTIADYTAPRKSNSVIPTDLYFFSEQGEERLNDFIEKGRRIIWDRLVLTATHKDGIPRPDELTEKLLADYDEANSISYGLRFKNMVLFPRRPESTTPTRRAPARIRWEDVLTR